MTLESKMTGPAASSEKDACLYRALFQHIDSACCVLEIEFDAARPVGCRIIESNAAFAREPGLAEVVANTGREVVADRDSQWLETFAQVAATGRSTRFLGYSIGLDRWFDVDVVRVMVDATYAVAALFSDVTRGRRAEMALRTQTAQLQTLFNAAPMGIYLVDEKFRLAQVNPAALAKFGDIPDLLGRDFEEVMYRLWPKPYADEIVRAFRGTLLSGQPHIEPERTEKRLDRRSTEIYSWRLERVPLPNGHFGVVCYFLDVSAEVLARRSIAASESRLRVLVQELHHRGRNLVAVIRSLASRAGMESTSLNDFHPRFASQLDAISRAQGLLSRDAMQESVAFDDILRSELSALTGSRLRAKGVTLEGPESVMLPAIAVQTLSLAIHELATNSVKYGALGTEAGRLDVRWRVEGVDTEATRLCFDWREEDLAPALEAPSDRQGGYGRDLIEHALPYELNAQTSYTLGPDFVHCSICVPLSAG